MINNLKYKLKSDEGAIGTVETIVLILIAAAISISVHKFIISPMLDNSSSVGQSIGEFTTSTDGKDDF